MSKMKQKFSSTSPLDIGPVEITDLKCNISWNAHDWPLYIKCRQSVDILQLSRIIQKDLKLEKPQILLSVVSDFRPLTHWNPGQDEINQLAIGLGKTASSARMWLSTNGIDLGSSRLFASALNQAKLWQKAIREDQKCDLNLFQHVCMGIVCEDRLTSDPIMQRYLRKVQDLGKEEQISSFKLEPTFDFPFNVENVQSTGYQKECFIDEHHSHFIFIQRDQAAQGNVEQMLSFDLMYQLSFESAWTELDLNVSKQPDLMLNNSQRKFRIPFVGLLIQGDVHTCAVVHEYLVKQVPLLVLQGTGGFADLLYFAYTELRSLCNQTDQERSQQTFDSPSNPSSEQSSLDQIYGESILEHSPASPGSQQGRADFVHEHLTGVESNELSADLTIEQLLNFASEPQTLNMSLFDFDPRINRSRHPTNRVYSESFRLSDANNCAKNVLTQRTLRTFPELARSKEELDRFQELLINCVRHSTQDGCMYLSFLPSDLNGKRLARLDEYLLSAYIRCSRHYQPDSGILLSSQQILNQNLSLTLVWNCPSIARDEIARHAANGPISIDKTLMQTAIFSSNRQEFVEIFMEAGFKLRQLFTMQMLEKLLTEAKSNAFFREVCCDRIMGMAAEANLDNELILIWNKLIHLTANIRNFFNISDFNFVNQAPNCLEYKSISLIGMWATLTLNFSLVRVIWQFHGHPIRFLLTICNMLTNLTNFVTDIGLQERIQTYHEEFGQVATDLLDVCNEKAPFRCDQLFYRHSIHYDGKILCDVAASSRVHSFLAHQSTQRWLSAVYFSGMQMKQNRRAWLHELSLVEPFVFVTCVLFVWPINYWIYFPAKTINQTASNSFPSFLSYHPVYEEITLNPSLHDQFSNSSAFTSHKPQLTEKQIYSHLNKLVNKSKEISSVDQSINLKSIDESLFEDELSVYDQVSMQSNQNNEQVNQMINNQPTLSLSTRWLIITNAPVTKFWLSQIFYLFYLTLFTWTVLQPACGQPRFDLLLFVWQSAILIEDLRRNYRIFSQLISIPLTGFKYAELSFDYLFLLLFYLGRILHLKSLAQHQYYVRMGMCLALLKAYIKYVGTYTPIHPKLGPLFFYLKLMSLRDSLRFLALCIPVVVSFGVAIQIALYPDQLMHFKNIANILYRSTYSMFLSIDPELLPTHTCEHNRLNRWQTNQSNDKCLASHFQSSTCANNGLWSYMFIFSFLMLQRMVLLNILNAMFNNSMMIMNATTIWRFQRFNLIMYFALSSPFPPPFNLLAYMYFAADKLIKCICRHCCKGSKVDSQQSKGQTEQNSNQNCFECDEKSSNFFWLRTSQIYLDKKRTQIDLKDLIELNKSSFLNQKAELIELQNVKKEIERSLYLMQVSGDKEAGNHFIEKLGWLIKK